MEISTKEVGTIKLRVLDIKHIRSYLLDNVLCIHDAILSFQLHPEISKSTALYTRCKGYLMEGSLYT